MEHMQLPERLQAIADQVPSCESMADIGCDHGYLPIYLIQTGRVQRAYAMDVNPGPLDQAKKHIDACGLGECMECRLSNGLAQLEAGEVQTVTIAGMGGMLIAQLLEEASPEVLQSLETLIVQPQTEPDVVRRKLHEKGFRIENEAMVYDRGKRYIICRAVHGEEQYEDSEYAYGRLLYQNRDPQFKELLERKLESLKDWMEKTQSRERFLQLEQEQLRIQQMLKSW